MLNPGTLNKRIVFMRYRDNSSDSDFLKTTQDAEPVREVWASVKATGGTESYEMERLANTVAYDVRTRFDPVLLDPELFILYEGRRFEIRSVVDIKERHEVLAFTCVEIRKAGQHGRGLLEL